MVLWCVSDYLIIAGLRILEKEMKWVGMLLQK